MSLLNPNLQNVQETNKTKEDRIKELVKSIREIQSSIEPYRESLKDLKKNYVQNGWLTKEELRLLLKAMRLLDEEIDIDEFVDAYRRLL